VKPAGISGIKRGKKKEGKKGMNNHEKVEKNSAFTNKY
jgi:hypothetical protein